VLFTRVYVFGFFKEYHIVCETVLYPGVIQIEIVWREGATCFGYIKKVTKPTDD